MKARLGGSMLTMSAVVEVPEDGEASGQMLGEGNIMGNARVQRAIDALAFQTKNIGEVVAALGLKTVAFEKSHSLDNPNAVFK